MKKPAIAIAVVLLAAAGIWIGSARAGEREREHEDGHARGSVRPAAVPDPVYVKECGACHLAYPPRMLPAASWKRMMAGLERHFGQDAELEPEVQAGLERWLVERAGTGRRLEGETTLRITELRRFRREHREVPADAASRPQIRSMANCAACHPGAERWDFDEDRVKIPRG